jgi:hypothetical protein
VRQEGKAVMVRIVTSAVGTLQQCNAFVTFRSDITYNIHVTLHTSVSLSVTAQSRVSDTVNR